MDFRFSPPQESSLLPCSFNQGFELNLRSIERLRISRRSNHRKNRYASRMIESVFTAVFNGVSKNLGSIEISVNRGES